MSHYHYHLAIHDNKERIIEQLQKALEDLQAHDGQSYGKHAITLKFHELIIDIHGWNHYAKE